jgi:lipopolysaccharide transport system permease protein
MVSGEPVKMTEIASITVKALPWAFFIGSIKFATGSLIGNSNLVTKIFFPREVFPISAVIANLFDFAVSSVLLIALIWVAGIGASVHLAWVPAILFLLFLFTMGLSMILSCANLFFRDVKYIVEVITTFAIFFTPVFYDASMLGEWETVALLNPVAVYLESLNSVIVLGEAPDPMWLLYGAAWAFGCFFLSWTAFHNAEVYFAENI